MCGLVYKKKKVKLEKHPECIPFFSNDKPVNDSVCIVAVLFKHRAEILRELSRLWALWDRREVTDGAAGLWVNTCFMLDQGQNSISSSWSHLRYFLKISSKSGHKFLSSVANNQMGRKTLSPCRSKLFHVENRAQYISVGEKKHIIKIRKRGKYNHHFSWLIHWLIILYSVKWFFSEKKLYNEPFLLLCKHLLSTLNGNLNQDWPLFVI